MNATFFYFLIESSVYLLFFVAIYKLAISNLTHFTWMRTYLLSSLTLSIILPLIRIPGQWSQSLLGDPLFEKPLSFIILNPFNVITPETINPATQADSYAGVWISMLNVLPAVYLIG